MIFHGTKIKDTHTQKKNQKTKKPLALVPLTTRHKRASYINSFSFSNLQLTLLRAIDHRLRELHLKMTWNSGDILGGDTQSQEQPQAKL